jgi:hypothetical protein
MQRIYACELTAEEYVASEGHRQVVAEVACPRCGGRRGWHRHGTYWRWMTGAVGQLLRMGVARFLCLACRRTVSYLPSFALSYRPIRVATLEAFLDGRRERDVQTWEELLRAYRPTPPVSRGSGTGWPVLASRSSEPWALPMGVRPVPVALNRVAWFLLTLR